MSSEYWTAEDRKMIQEGPPEDQVQPDPAGKIPEKRRSNPKTADEQEEDGLFTKGRP